jgi:SAM-dependent methyltransferase
MILCPDCRDGLPGLDAEMCHRCGWTPEQRDGLPIFLSSRDRSDRLFARYLANYDAIAEVDLKESIQPEGFLAVQAEHLHHHIGDVRGQSVCDIGIGKGILLGRLQHCGPARLTGVDIATRYLDRFSGCEDVTLVFANAENLPFRDEFDLVVAADVVEHVVNLGDVLVSAHEALVPGGRFVVRVPYREDMTKHARLRGCPYEFVHLRNFAKDNLTDVLRRSGFRVETIHYDGFLPSRGRGVLTRTRVGRRAWEQVVERVFGGEEGIFRVKPYIGRLLMTPVVITAIASKP